MRKVLFILGALTDADLQWMLDAGDVQRPQEGVTIIEEGQPTDSVFIIIDGEFSVAKSGTEIARLGTGEVLGEMSMLDSRPSSADVSAVTDAVVFAVPQQLLRSKLKADTGFASRFYHAMCLFLINRLNRADTMVGKGPRIAAEVSDTTADEIAPDTMESVFLAGTRFDWFLERVRSR
jgi:CRP/FNR family cyclic AMP-dependent transcriptional regulator